MAALRAADHDGDPWVARWTASDGTQHKLYEGDVALLAEVEAGRVETDSRCAKWVYVGDMRHRVRDPVTKTFWRLVEIGMISGCTEQVQSSRPELSTAGLPFERTTWGLADLTVHSVLAALR